jgi:hypothetical protein
MQHACRNRMDLGMGGTQVRRKQPRHLLSRALPTALLPGLSGLLNLCSVSFGQPCCILRIHRGDGYSRTHDRRAGHRGNRTAPSRRARKNMLRDSTSQDLPSGCLRDGRTLMLQVSTAFHAHYWFCFWYIHFCRAATNLMFDGLAQLSRILLNECFTQWKFKRTCNEPVGS